ncbi:MAG: hypothetical protein GC192_23080 [Bacteroidetes bacterium]|nr:hypothetical protein [Bacteroidota bacterium]
MIYLNPNDFKSASQKHFDGLEQWLLKRIDSRKKLRENLKLFIKSNLSVILMGEPRRLKNIHARFYSEVSKVVGLASERRKFDSHLRYIFNYKSFADKKQKEYDAYDLAENLGIRVCAYCNRMYTITVQTGASKPDHVTRPEFDHFFSQERYPLLSLSFFNLIPSCKICNSTLKGNEKFALHKHLHPYLDDCWQGFQFSFAPVNTQSLLGAKPNHAVLINTDTCTDVKLETRIRKNLEVFKIADVYNGHGEEISDLLRLRNVLNDSYLEILQKHTYPHLNISEDELYRLAFGAYRTEGDFHKRPFSKLKKDILKELGIIS